MLTSLPVHSHDRPPSEDYRLRVDGLVDRLLELSVEELRVLPEAGLDDDFVCLEGWTVANLRWRGVRLASVLQLAGIRPEARWVQASVPGFSLPLPLSEAGNALLALQLNDAALAPEHGAPVRLLVPGGECFTSVKWLDHLELRAEPAENTAEAVARARLG
ncbi:MAG TPA: molybdopterin-dependent oxidoreductase [Tepidiformaceae bacterium]|nr:molybdopterin-dependent oxidoreductase [Tepidiformaceae bacterium]